MRGKAWLFCLLPLLLCLALILGCGKAATPQEVSNTDSTPPAITEIVVKDVKTNSAAIQWTTDEPATSQVEYGATVDLGEASELDANLVYSHSVLLEDLSPSTTYHFIVRSRDADGNRAASDAETFTTSSESVSPTTPEIPTNPFAISDVKEENVASDSATVSWTTNEASTSQVDYGSTVSYGSSTPLDSNLVKAHKVTIVGLSPATLYHYRVGSKAESEKEATSEDRSFTTAPESSPAPPPSPPPFQGNLRIQSVDLDAEIVTIVNSGDSVVDMTGCRLVSKAGNQQYTFPSSFQLGSGGTVQVVSGRSALDNPPAQLLWTHAYIWNNSSDPAELYDAAGNLVSSYP